MVIAVAAILFKAGHSGDDRKSDHIPATAGRYLFFDTRLSYNATKSCASCHDPRFAFTDGYRRSITASGDQVLHNSPSLINAGTYHVFDLANPAITTLEQQHARPLFNTHPVELGAAGNETVILKRLQQDAHYRQLFREIFPSDEDPLTFTHIIQCIAAYVRTLESRLSPYDRFIAGDSTALTPSAKQGMALFFSSRLHCSSCHAGPLFTQAALTGNADSVYANTGLYQKYPAADGGIIAVTGRPQDEGRFKIPSLRNVAVTAPYMHDGSVNTLDEVITLYSRGGKQTISGPLAGDGSLNPYKDKRLRPFLINPEERQQLIDFIYALTDSSVFSNPLFQNPFVASGK